MEKTFGFGEILKLEDLIDYEKGKALKKEILSSDAGKLILISFDDNALLPAHAAPGNAVIFALKGKADITYEGKTFKIHEGESFAMAKGAEHSIKSDGKFKMALVIYLG